MSKAQVGQWVQYTLTKGDRKAWYPEGGLAQGEVAAVVTAVSDNGGGLVEVITLTVFVPGDPVPKAVFGSLLEGSGPGGWRPVPVEIPTVHMVRYPDENLEATLREVGDREQRALETIRNLEATIKNMDTNWARDLNERVKGSELLYERIRILEEDLTEVVNTYKARVDNEVNERVLAMGHEASARVSKLQEERDEAVVTANSYAQDSRELNGIREWLLVNASEPLAGETVMDHTVRALSNLQAVADTHRKSYEILSTEVDGRGHRILELEGTLRGNALAQEVNNLAAKLQDSHENEVRLIGERDQRLRERDELGKMYKELQESEFRYRNERNRAEASVQELIEERDSLADQISAAEENEVILRESRNASEREVITLTRELELLRETCDGAQGTITRLRRQLESTKKLLGVNADDARELGLLSRWLHDNTTGPEAGETVMDHAVRLFRKVNQEVVDLQAQGHVNHIRCPGCWECKTCDHYGACPTPDCPERSAHDLAKELNENRERFETVARIVGHDSSDKIRIKELEDMLASNLNHTHDMERQLQTSAAKYLETVNTLESRLENVKETGNYYKNQINRLAEHLGLTGGPEDGGSPVDLAISLLDSYRELDDRGSWHLDELMRLTNFLGVTPDKWTEGEENSPVTAAIVKINQLNSALGGAHALIGDAGPPSTNYCAILAPVINGRPVYCSLPIGHPGWHCSESGTEWGQTRELELDPQTEAARAILNDYLVEIAIPWAPTAGDQGEEDCREMVGELLEAAQIAVTGATHPVLRDMARVLGALERLEPNFCHTCDGTGGTPDGQPCTDCLGTGTYGLEPAPPFVDIYEVRSNGALVWWRCLPAGDIMFPGPISRPDGSITLPGHPEPLVGPWEFKRTLANGEELILAGPGVTTPEPSAEESEDTEK